MLSKFEKSLSLGFVLIYMFVLSAPVWSQTTRSTNPDFKITTTYYVIKPEAVGSPDFRQIQSLFGTWTSDAGTSTPVNELMKSNKWQLKAEGLSNADNSLIIRPSLELVTGEARKELLLAFINLENKKLASNQGFREEEMSVGGQSKGSWAGTYSDTPVTGVVGEEKADWVHAHVMTCVDGIAARPVLRMLEVLVATIQATQPPNNLDAISVGTNITAESPVTIILGPAPRVLAAANKPADQPFVTVLIDVHPIPK